MYLSVLCMYIWCQKCKIRPFRWYIRWSLEFVHHWILKKKWASDMKIVIGFRRSDSLLHKTIQTHLMKIWFSLSLFWCTYVCLFLWNPSLWVKLFKKSLYLHFCICSLENTNTCRCTYSTNQDKTLQKAEVNYWGPRVCFGFCLGWPGVLEQT